MSTTVVTPGADQATEKLFDSKAYIAKQNEAQQAKLTGAQPAAKTEEKKPDAPKADDKPAATTQASGEGEPDDKHTSGNGSHLSRSQRREFNRLQRELGEAKGRNALLEELIAKGVVKPGDVAKPETAAAESKDPEPKRADFADYDEYLRATSRWEGRNEAVKVVAKQQGETEQLTAFKSRLQAASTKCEADIKLLPDWDEVTKAANEDGPEVEWDKHTTLTGMIGTSDVQAFVLYHFAKNPDALEKMLELTKDPNEQIRQFHRLEGRLEKLYTKETAAQAAESAKGETPKDRTTPEKAAQARETTADRDARKPKPSAEVAARGSSSAPEEPAVGSAAWMMRRNQTQFSKT